MIIQLFGAVFISQHHGLPPWVAHWKDGTAAWIRGIPDGWARCLTPWFNPDGNMMALFYSLMDGDMIYPVSTVTGWYRIWYIVY